MPNLLRVLILSLCVATFPALAQLQIEITRGVDNPTPIAVVPFGWSGSGASPEDVARIIDSDLARSGQFSPVSRRDMLSYPSRGSELYFRDWRAINSDYVLIGRYELAAAGNLKLSWQLFDSTRELSVEEGRRHGSGFGSADVSA
jgi:TolB protein